MGLPSLFYYYFIRMYIDEWQISFAEYFKKIRAEPGSCVAAWVEKLGGIKAFPAFQDGAATDI